MIDLIQETNLDASGWASFSSDKKYRYTLGRIINYTYKHKDPRGILWIMLNPSTADAFKLDPTLTRCFNYSKEWGYDHMVIMNLFAYRATNPKELLKLKDPVGPENDRIIKCGGHVNNQINEVILGWGSFKLAQKRKFEVMKILENAGCLISCLGVNKDGQPKHPLYLKKDVTKYPVVFKSGSWYIKGLETS